MFPEKCSLWAVQWVAVLAILLGEKYPELYSGVLDLCGAKNIAVTVNNCIIVITVDAWRNQNYDAMRPNNS